MEEIATSSFTYIERYVTGAETINWRSSSTSKFGERHSDFQSLRTFTSPQDNKLLYVEHSNRTLNGICTESFIYYARGNRRLSLAALPGLPAASRGFKLSLLADTRSVFQSL